LQSLHAFASLVPSSVDLFSFANPKATPPTILSSDEHAAHTTALSLPLAFVLFPHMQQVSLPKNWNIVLDPVFVGQKDAAFRGLGQLSNHEATLRL
jgi:hypothetical protein